jgi:two-component system NtrC family sensor kinase
MHRVLERQLKKLGLSEAPPTAEQWRAFLERVDRAYQEADQDRYTLERSLDLSSLEMRKRFEELRSAQGQLLEASRKAGMADVAASVLHNIGNVLNSVNVSANISADLLRRSARAGLSKSLKLLTSQPAPGRFLDEDPRGKKLLEYLVGVDAALGEEREQMSREFEALSKNVAHIKTIVSQQLASARGDLRQVRMLEQVSLAELAEDAVSVLRSTLGVHDHLDVAVECEPMVVTTDRHKVFQIILNLLTNARDATRSRAGGGHLIVRSGRAPNGQLFMEVEDDGVGIAPDALERIFQHGFTTKPDGHGFGLHASACAAIELEGSLQVHSDGPGRGARFTLLIPPRHSAAGPRSGVHRAVTATA